MCQLFVRYSQIDITHATGHEPCTTFGCIECHQSVHIYNRYTCSSDCNWFCSWRTGTCGHSVLNLRDQVVLLLRQTMDYYWSSVDDDIEEEPRYVHIAAAAIYQYACRAWPLSPDGESLVTQGVCTGDAHRWHTECDPRQHFQHNLQPQSAELHGTYL